MVSVKISAASEVGFWGVSRTKQRWDETSHTLESDCSSPTIICDIV